MSSSLKSKFIKKSRFSFKRKKEYDLALLSQVQSLRPLGASTISAAKVIWNQIAKNLQSSSLQMAVTARSCRERMVYLQTKAEESEIRRKGAGVQGQGGSLTTQEEDKSNESVTISEMSSPFLHFKDEPLFMPEDQTNEVEMEADSSPATTTILDPLNSVDENFRIEAPELTNIFNYVVTTPNSSNVQNMMEQNTRGATGSNRSAYDNSTFKSTDTNLNQSLLTSLAEKIYQLSNQVKLIERRMSKLDGWTNKQDVITQRVLKKIGLELETNTPCQVLPVSIQERLDTRALSKSQPRKQILLIRQDPNFHNSNNNSSGRNKLDMQPIVRVERFPSFETTDLLSSYPNSPINKEQDSDDDDSASRSRDDSLRQSAEEGDLSATETAICKIKTPAAIKMQLKSSKDLTKHELVHSVIEMLPAETDREHSALGNSVNLGPQEEEQHSTTVVNQKLKPRGRQFRLGGRGQRGLHRKNQKKPDADPDTDTDHQQQISEYSCEFCELIFQTKRAYLSHKSLLHPAEKRSKRFNCKLCPKTYQSGASLRQHVRVFHENRRDYICEICGQAFRRECYLKVHLFIHSEVRSFKCRYCESSFHQKRTLDSHEKRHFGSAAAAGSSGSSSRAQCTQCGQLFTRLENLRKHVKLVHDKIRAYHCQLCPKAFLTATHLKYHVGTHSNPNSRKRGLNKDTKTFKLKRVGGFHRVKQVVPQFSELEISQQQQPTTQKKQQQLLEQTIEGEGQTQGQEQEEKIV